MCVYYVCTCVFVYIRKCICTHISAYVYSCVHVYTYMYVYTHICVCIYVCTCIYVYIYVYDVRICLYVGVIVWVGERVDGRVSDMYVCAWVSRLSKWSADARCMCIMQHMYKFDSQTLFESRTLWAWISRLSKFRADPHVTFTKKYRTEYVCVRIYTYTNTHSHAHTHTCMHVCKNVSLSLMYYLSTHRQHLTSKTRKCR